MMKINTPLLFALMIFMLSLEFAQNVLEEQDKLFKSKEFLKVIDQHLDLEHCVFKQIRKGVREGVCEGGTFQRKEQKVYINSENPLTNSQVYDIMEDESFIWRRKE